METTSLVLYAKKKNGYGYKDMHRENAVKRERHTTSSTTSIAGQLERRAEMPRLRQRVRSCLAASCRCTGRLGSTPAPPCTAIAHFPIFFRLLLLTADALSPPLSGLFGVSLLTPMKLLMLTLYKLFPDFKGIYELDFN